MSKKGRLNCLSSLLQLLWLISPDERDRLWAALDAAMALTLYEPAFAVVVQLDHATHRRRIALLTLAGGLASPIFWPLTQHLMRVIGWRHTTLVYAVLHLFVCVPLHGGTLQSASVQSAIHAAAGADAPCGSVGARGRPRGRHLAVEASGQPGREACHAHGHRHRRRCGLSADLGRRAFPVMTILRRRARASGPGRSAWANATSLADLAR